MLQTQFLGLRRLCFPSKYSKFGWLALGASCHGGQSQMQLSSQERWVLSVIGREVRCPGQDT